MENSNPLVLAFAVAALQTNGADPVEATVSTEENWEVSTQGEWMLKRIEMTMDEETEPRPTTSHGTAAPALANQSLIRDEGRAETAGDIVILLETINRRKKSLGDQEVDMEVDLKRARGRERNREHARKTRIRKKAHLEALQTKVENLETERHVLQQQMEECCIASILLGLSSGLDSDSFGSLVPTPGDSYLTSPSSSSTASVISTLSQTMPSISNRSTKRRWKVAVEHATQPFKVAIDGQTTLMGGGKTHVNWKSGSFHDDNGNRMQLTREQLQHLRRERNRCHAKMTRMRKKCFMSQIEKKIDDLESDIHRMRTLLSKVGGSEEHLSQKVVTPTTSPDLKPLPYPSIDLQDDNNEEASVLSTEQVSRFNRSRLQTRNVKVHNFILSES